MIYKLDSNNNIYTTISIPSFWYAYDVGISAAALVVPACFYDSIIKHGICSTGDIENVSIGLYFQVGNGDPNVILNLPTFYHEESINNLMTINHHNTDPNMQVPVGAQIWDNEGGTDRAHFVIESYGYLSSYPSKSSIKIVVPNDVLSLFDDGDVYSVAYLLVQFQEQGGNDLEGGVPTQGTSYYVAVIGYSKITLSALQAPSTPEKLTIVSVRDPSKMSKTDPDIVLQWNASKPGSAPITGYEVCWGTDKNNLANTIPLLIKKSPDLQYNPGDNTFTYSMPNGTLPILQSPSDLYYFAVIAFDSGDEVQTFNSVELTSKWWKHTESWFPPQYLLATCPPIHNLPLQAGGPGGPGGPGQSQTNSNPPETIA